MNNDKWTAYLHNPPRIELLEEDFDEANDYDPNAVKICYKTLSFISLNTFTVTEKNDILS